MKIMPLFVLLCTASLLQAQPVSVENNQLQLRGSIRFVTGSTRLAPGSDSVLMQVKEYLDAKTYITTLRIESHTGETGAAAQTLSEQRALVIGKWLVAKGVDCKRLVATGFGSNKPAFANSSPEGRAKNTRQVFVIAALRNRLIGGMPADGGGAMAGDPCQ